MSSSFVLIQQALHAKLLEAPALAGGRVFAPTDRSIDKEVDSAIVLRRLNTVATETVLGAHDWQTAFQVECYARGTALVSADAAADALLVDALARIYLADFTGLAVAAVNTRPAIDWDSAVLATTHACATSQVVVQHRTPVGSLAPWPGP